jgi:branched-chain amino acid transport system substrate-binding protein
MMPPGEVHLEGLIDLAAKKGLKTLALINRDDLGERDTTQGAIGLAKKKGVQVVSADAYPSGTTDFSAILTKVRAADADVLGVTTNVFEDGVTIIRQMKALNVNPRLVGGSLGLSLPRLYEVLGRDAERRQPVAA